MSSQVIPVNCEHSGLPLKKCGTNAVPLLQPQKIAKILTRVLTNGGNQCNLAFTNSKDMKLVTNQFIKTKTRTEGAAEPGDLNQLRAPPH